MRVRYGSLPLFSWTIYRKSQQVPQKRVNEQGRFRNDSLTAGSAVWAHFAQGHLFATGLTLILHRPINPALTLVASTNPADPPSTPNTPTSTTILMTIIRLVSKSTDFVITINLPHIPVEEGINAASAASGNSSGDGSREGNELENGPSGTLVEDGLKVRDEVLRTLTIHDWDLFGEVEGGN